MTDYLAQYREYVRLAETNMRRAKEARDDVNAQAVLIAAAQVYATLAAAAARVVG